jgi:hypothetical protein
MYITYSAPLLPFVAIDDNVTDTPGSNDPEPPFNGYPSYGALQFVGMISTGSQLIDASGETLDGLQPGQKITGNGLPPNTYITNVNFATGIVTVSQFSTTNGFIVFTAQKSDAIPNLPPTAVDIPPIGATIQLIQNREFSRNLFMVQPDPRKATDVPAGAIMNSTQRMEIFREKRIAQEVARIRKQYTKHAQR